VDRSGLNNDIDVVIGEHIAKAFCYLSEFEHLVLELGILCFVLCFCLLYGVV
jgi:hypothetical protein